MDEVTMPTRILAEGSVTLPTAAPEVKAAVRTAVLADGMRFGNYVIERNLDQGGMGMVYLARHSVIETRYAIKILDPNVALRNGEFVQRFIREAKLAGKVRHPNLIGVHDAGRDEKTGLYYIVMDYVGGGSLRQRLKSEGVIAEREALLIVRSVADALLAAKGVVHRDIKPENIMFDTDGTVKLVDLGIAKSLEMPVDDFKSRAESVFGTPSYMSPEQVMDSATVDARADIWSLGIVFYEMLAGKRPFAATRLAEVIAELIKEMPFPDVRRANSAISARTAEVVAKMLAKDRDRRLSSPEELIAALTEQDQRPQDSVSGDKIGRFDRGAKMLVGIGLGASFLLFVGGFLAIYCSHKGDEETKSKEPFRAISKPAPAPVVCIVSNDQRRMGRPRRTNDIDRTAVWVGSGIKGYVPGIVIEPKTGKRLEREVESLIVKKPRIVYLCLASIAAESQMSLDRFGLLVEKIGMNLREAGIPAIFVICMAARGGLEYDAVVKEVCKRFSFEVREFNELGKLR